MWQAQESPTYKGSVKHPGVGVGVAKQRGQGQHFSTFFGGAQNFFQHFSPNAYCLF